MKKRKKKTFLSRVIKFIVFLIIFSFIFDKFNFENEGDSVNKKYDGVGQQIVNNANGYNTIFITNKNKKYIEYKQGGNSSWALNDYWGGTMEENGCGITSLAIIASGYGENVTPEDLRKKYAPHLDSEKIHNELKYLFNINSSDFYFSNAYFSKDKIFKHLEKDNPILICVWNKPDNKWTEKSHYMVILACDRDNKIYISNPSENKNENPSRMV